MTTTGVPAFGFATAQDVRFGAGRVGEVPAAVAGLGVRSVLVVTGASGRHADGVLAGLDTAGIAHAVVRVAGEPTVDDARAAVEAARTAQARAVVGLGGGSALDLAKAVAVLAANGSDPLDHLEVVGRGRPFEQPALPWVAVPTTAGTGSEVTRNAVLSAGQGAGAVKASLRHPSMLARVAVVDPDLLAGQPPAVVAAAGMDALTQLIEPLLSSRANPLTDALCREGIPRSARALPVAASSLDADAGLREDLALASLLGGLSLANAGLGAVHGLAAPLGALLGAPHGAVCAALLAPTLEVNRLALAERAPGHPALDRLREVAVLLTGDPDATAQDGVRHVRDLQRSLALPGLAAFGLTEADLPAVVEAGLAASSMRANPLPLTVDEVTAALRDAL